MFFCLIFSIKAAFVKSFFNLRKFEFFFIKIFFIENNRPSDTICMYMRNQNYVHDLNAYISHDITCKPYQFFYFKHAGNGT